MRLEIDNQLHRILSRLSYLVYAKESRMANNVTPLQRQILMALAEAGKPMMLTSVAYAVGVSPATVSDALVAMRAKGLVNKDRMPPKQRWEDDDGVIRKTSTDARALAVTLTEDGERWVAEGGSDLADTLFVLDQAEKELFMEIADKLVRSIYSHNKPEDRPKKKREPKEYSKGKGLMLPAVQVEDVDKVHTRLQRAVELKRPDLVIDFLLAKCADSMCEICAGIVCPHHDPRHFKGKCPSCSENLKQILSRATTSDPQVPKEAIARTA